MLLPTRLRSGLLAALRFDPYLAGIVAIARSFASTGSVLRVSGMTSSSRWTSSIVHCSRCRGQSHGERALRRSTSCSCGAGTEYSAQATRPCVVFGPRRRDDHSSRVRDHSPTRPFPTHGTHRRAARRGESNARVVLTGSSAYSLVTFLSGILFLFFIRSLQRGSAADYVFWSLSSAAAMSTHYVRACSLRRRACGCWSPGRVSPRATLGRVRSLAVVALALLPLALHQRATSQQAWIKDWPLAFRVKEGGRHLLVGPAAPDDRLWIVAAISAVLATTLIMVRGDSTERRSGAIGATLTAVVILVPLGAAVVGTDYFLDRNLIVALVP